MYDVEIGSLIHHDARDYDEAVLEAMPHARRKLEQMIETGRENQAHVVEQLMDEVSVRRDFLVPAREVKFEGLALDESGGFVLQFPEGRIADEALALNEYSLGQVAAQLSVPVQFLTQLAREKPDIAADLLNDLNYRLGRGRRFVREVRGTARAVLSDNYKPIDQGEVIEAFINSVNETGAVPLDGFSTDRRFVLRAIIPQLLTPLAHEVIALGVHLSSSDYGAGALNMAVFQNPP